MQAGQIIVVRTNPATQFTATLAQNAALTLNLAMDLTGAAGVNPEGYLDPGVGAGNTVRSRLKGIVIASVQNLAWEISLWGTALFNGSATNPSLAQLFGKHSFATGDAFRIGATGLYYYAINGLDIPYQDTDRTGQVHLMLVNRSAGGKSADAAGAIGIQLAFENTYSI